MHKRWYANIQGDLLSRIIKLVIIMIQNLLINEKVNTF